MKNYSKLLEKRFREERLDIVGANDLSYFKSVAVVLSVINEMLKEREPLFEAEIAVNLGHVLGRKTNDPFYRGNPAYHRGQFRIYINPFFDLRRNSDLM